MQFTPLARQLQQRLEDRRAFFHNWLFQWHRLKEPNGLVEVDLFDGRVSHMGGLAFWGSPRDVFWDAITRGVRKEILDQFEWVDEQARRYNREVALASIDQAVGLLLGFARGVRRDAIAKDRILRGNGVQFPCEEDAGVWRGSSENEVRGYADALKKALPDKKNETAASSSPDKLSSRLNRLWHENQWWLGPISLIIGLAGILALL